MPEPTRGQQANALLYERLGLPIERSAGARFINVPDLTRDSALEDLTAQVTKLTDQVRRLTDKLEEKEKPRFDIYRFDPLIYKGFDR